MKFYLLLSMIAILGLSGCTSSTAHLKAKQQKVARATTYEAPTPHKSELYQKTMRSVASGIKNDANYQRIALNTPEKKAWFRSLTYRLWDRQMTRQQFIAEGLSYYPSHRYEFEFVVKGFANAYNQA